MLHRVKLRTRTSGLTLVTLNLGNLEVMNKAAKGFRKLIRSYKALSRS